MTPANDNRPATFDARVMAYLPMIRLTVGKLVPHAKREDLVQDVLAYVFSHWTSFRGDDYGPGSGFHNWLKWQVFGVASAQKNLKRVTVVPDHKGKYANTIGQPADQERALIAKDIMGKATGRDGAILLRRGMGCGLKEIGTEIGLTVERVRQLEMRGRASLLKVAA